VAAPGLPSVLVRGREELASEQALVIGLHERFEAGGEAQPSWVYERYGVKVRPVAARHAPRNGNPALRTPVIAAGECVGWSQSDPIGETWCTDHSPVAMVGWWLAPMTMT
jgi:hypothetical protein